MPFIGSVEGTFGYGRGGSEPINNNRLFVEGATYIPTTDNRLLLIQKTAVDSSNNIYVSGYYNSNVAITLKNMSGYGQSPSSWTLPITSNLKSFLIKYDESGTVLWALYFSDTGSNGSISDTTSIAVDSSNNLYWVGSYSASSTAIIKQISVGGVLENSSYSLPSTLNTSGFIVKLNSSGQVIWTTFVRPGTGGLQRYANCKYVSIVGSLVFVAGDYSTDNTLASSNAWLGKVNGTTADNSLVKLLPTAASTGGFPIGIAFLGCWGIAGDAKYATVIIGSTLNDTGDDSTPYDLGTDGTSLYLTGLYGCTSTFTLTLYRPSSDNTTQVPTSDPNKYTLPATVGTVSNVFIIKYNSLCQPQGSAYIQQASDTPIPRSISVKSGVLYVVVNRSSLLNIYNANGLTQSLSTIKVDKVGSGSGLIRFNTSLVCQWATLLPMTTLSVFIDSNGTVFVGGIVSSSTPTKILFYNASGNTQILTNYPSITTISSFESYAILVKYSAAGKFLVGTFIQANNIPNASNSIRSIARVGSYIYAVGGYSYSLNTTVGTLYNGIGNNQKITDPAYTLPCPWAEFSSTATNNRSGLIVRYSVVE
jgi:hypothetical protein